MDSGSAHVARGLKKRVRDDNNDDLLPGLDLDRAEKRARPASGDSSIDGWHPRDSVISTPTAPGLAQWQMANYDSDDHSSLASEPGSPEDIDMLSGDEMERDDAAAALSQSPDELPPPPSSSRSHRPTSPWEARIHATRVPTPILPSRPGGSRPLQLRDRIQQHIRQRHPQEITSSGDHLEVPPTIDEADAPTPPSAAADAAGSQLSMLSVSDMDVEPGPHLPSISLETASRSPSRGPPGQYRLHPTTLDHLSSGGSAVMDASDVDSMDEEHDGLRGAGGEMVVRRQRQRSGALSAGAPSPSPSPSPSPHLIAGPTSSTLARQPPPPPPSPTNFSSAAGPINTAARRGFSMGFRQDCEKCRLRVPGHMNHFIT